MDTNKNNSHTPTARAGNAAAGNGASPSSVPMANSGSKGRSGGSKFKNLLAKLSGGHHGSSKGVKTVAGGSSTAAAARLADEAAPSSSSSGNMKNKASTNSKMDSLSNKNNTSAADKRASKLAGPSQRVTGATGTTSNMTPSNKQDTKGKGVAMNTSGQPPSNGAINNADSGSLPSIPTPAMYPVDYFGSKGVLPDDTQQQQQQADNHTLNTSYGNESDDDEIDGADADASIRPITPSSIDASSSFTGSTSLHSLAPTSRTFKSFRTGHSKTSASTKPTLLSSGGGGANGTSILAPSTSAAGGNANNAAVSPAGLNNDNSTSPPNSVRSSSNQNQSRADGASISQSLTLQSDKQKEKEKAIEASMDETQSTNEAVDMHDPDANRIATSLHSVEGVIMMPSSPRSVRSGSSELPSTAGMTSSLQPSVAILQQASRHGPRASPLRNSFTGQLSNLAAAPALTAATEEESESGSQVAQPQRTPRDSEWTTAEQQQGDENEGELDNFRIPEARAQEQQTDSSSIATNNQDHQDHVMRSSASITFSKLPPATPSSISSAQLYSAPGSPGRLSSYTRHLHNMDRSEDDNDGNSSYTGDRDRNDGNGGIGAGGGEGGIYHYPRYSAPDPSNNPRASSPPPDNASMLTLASSTGGGGGGERAPSVYTAASRYRDGFSGVGNGGGNAPSIVDSMAGHNRYRNTGANEDASIRAIAPSRRGSTDSIGSKWSAAILSQKESSYHGANANGASGLPVDGSNNGLVSDNASFKKRTPSLRTVATTSSYYAAPSIPSTTELKA